MWVKRKIQKAVGNALIVALGSHLWVQLCISSDNEINQDSPRMTTYLEDPEGKDGQLLVTEENRPALRKKVDEDQLMAYKQKHHQFARIC